MIFFHMMGDDKVDDLDWKTEVLMGYECNYIDQGMLQGATKRMMWWGSHGF